jgi:hypothetical protein
VSEQESIKKWAIANRALVALDKTSDSEARIDAIGQAMDSWARFCVAEKEAQARRERTAIRSLYGASARVWLRPPSRKDGIPEGIFAEAVPRGDGPTRWAIRDGQGQCMGRDGCWTWEPMGSQRDDAWLAEHRFVTLREAMEVYKASQGEE